MKYYILFIFFIFHFVESQTQRFVYKIEYKRDSTSENKFKINAVLDINQESIKFYPYNFIGLDSMNLKSKNNKMSSTSPFDLIVTKKKRSDFFENYIFIGTDYFVYPSTEKINWTIDQDFKTEGDFKLQKAQTYFKGRHWIAWFSSDIPLNYGPYKFGNLPGLIFEIYDIKGNYKFKIIKNFKIPIEYDTERIVETNFGKKPIQISFEKYIKLLKNAYYNPFAEYRGKTGDWTLGIFGRQIKTVKQLDEVRKLQQNNIKKYNNPIELWNAIKYK